MGLNLSEEQRRRIEHEERVRLAEDSIGLRCGNASRQHRPKKLGLVVQVAGLF
jgi:hypothetical protein